MMETTVKKLSWYVFATMIMVALIFVFMLFKTKELTPSFGGVGSYSNASSTTYVTVAGKATILLPKDVGRAGAYFQNITATVAYLSYHATTSPNSVPTLGDKEFVIPLAASGGTYVINNTNLWVGQVIASSSAAVTIRVMEIH